MLYIIILIYIEYIYKIIQKKIIKIGQTTRTMTFMSKENITKRYFIYLKNFKLHPINKITKLTHFSRPQLMDDTSIAHYSG